MYIFKIVNFYPLYSKLQCFVFATMFSDNLFQFLTFKCLMEYFYLIVDIDLHYQYLIFFWLYKLYFIFVSGRCLCDH